MFCGWIYTDLRFKREAAVLHAMASVLNRAMKIREITSTSAILVCGSSRIILKPFLTLIARVRLRAITSCLQPVPLYVPGLVPQSAARIQPLHIAGPLERWFPEGACQIRAIHRHPLPQRPSGRGLQC